MTREEAKKWLEEMKKGYMPWSDEVLNTVLDMAIFALEKNESAEEWYKLFCEKLDSALEKWIPIAERLPEEGKVVLCSVKDELDEMYVIINMFDKSPFWTDGTITAWQPLPEPYKAEKGGE